MSRPLYWSVSTNNAIIQAYSSTDLEKLKIQCMNSITGLFSIDYPNVCKQLNIATHPALYGAQMQLGKESTNELTTPTLSTERPKSPLMSPAGKSRTAATKVTTPASSSGPNKKGSKNIQVISSEVLQKESVAIRLFGHQIDMGTMTAMQCIVPGNAHFRSGHIIHSSFTVETFNMLIDIISKAPSTVQRFHLEFITIETDEEQRAQLFQRLIASLPSSIVFLSLRGNKLTDEVFANALSTLVTTNRSLIGIDLSSNSLSSNSAKHIADLIEQHPEIAFINLSGNRFNDQDVSIMTAPIRATLITDKEQGKALKKDPKNRVIQTPKGLFYRIANNRLREFNLSWNNLTDVGVSALIEIIKESIQYNSTEKSENANAEEIFEGRWNKLEMVDVSHNFISQENWLQWINFPCAVMKIHTTHIDRTPN
jgi:hypothetical protein